MIIRVILIAGIIVLLLWFLNQSTTTRGQAWSKLATLFLLLFAISSIAAPQIIDSLAHAVGVGRGADLLLYGLTVAFLATSLTNYMHRQDESAKIIRLARKIAVLEAKREKHNKNILDKVKGLE
ncbi:MAG: hypothetical protein JWO41_179 [Candidatus Saccharibacteria bacterium]|nr:hypothetical protein [Candidatus Saccharibacteria bacterium]